MKEKRPSLILAILNLLRTNSDEKHPLRLSQISALLLPMNLHPTRKTITNNISLLREAGFPLQYKHGWFYKHEFTVAELSFMIQLINSSNTYSEIQQDELVQKLKRMGSIYEVLSIT